MDKPTAAPHRWPYTEHRTLEQVRLDEERQREVARQYYARTRKSWRTA